MTANAALAEYPTSDPLPKTARVRRLGKGDVRCLLNRLVGAGHPVRVRYITGQRLDIDDAPDPARARNLL